jgi:hypothetical protein
MKRSVTEVMFDLMNAIAEVPELRALPMSAWVSRLQSLTDELKRAERQASKEDARAVRKATCKQSLQVGHEGSSLEARCERS